MLLSSKKMAFLGLLLAVDVILVVLSSILEFNTLFLLGAASFCVGIAIREAGLRFGFGFFLASLLLGFILSPNKLYCITYAAMGLYLLIDEYAFDRLVNVRRLKNNKELLWVIKYISFNAMYLPIILFLPRLLFGGKLNFLMYGMLIVLGQIVLFIYDRAYDYFQRYIWGRIRKKLNFK